jgi:hypothetical protein
MLIGGISITFPMLLILGIGISCAKKPSVVVRAPWTRTSGSPRQLQPGMKIQVAVAGQTGPLLGSEDLLQQQLSEKLSSLLQRRGYVIVDGQADFKLMLTYKTERTDKLVSRVMSSHSIGSTTGAAVSQGYLSLGVAVAQSVGSTTETSVATTTELHRGSQGCLCCMERRIDLGFLRPRHPQRCSPCIPEDSFASPI